MSRSRDGNGKGDLKRPLVVPEDQFNKNWDAIFGKSSIKVKDAFEETVEQHEEFFKQLAEHERECGK